MKHGFFSNWILFIVGLGIIALAVFFLFIKPAEFLIPSNVKNDYLNLTKNYEVSYSLSFCVRGLKGMYVASGNTGFLTKTTYYNRRGQELASKEVSDALLLDPHTKLKSPINIHEYTCTPLYSSGEKEDVTLSE